LASTLIWLLFISARKVSLWLYTLTFCGLGGGGQFQEQKDSGAAHNVIEYLRKQVLESQTKSSYIHKRLYYYYYYYIPVYTSPTYIIYTRTPFFDDIRYRVHTKKATDSIVL
jgi:hypothetical protein